MITAAILAAAALGAQPAPDAVGQSVTYEADGTEFEGYLAEAEGEAKGLVLIIHDWDGLDAYEERRAEMLAKMGYDAFAADLYGAGNRPETVEGRKAEVGKLYDDRALMRSRMLAALAEARERTGTQGAVVMGYCFGGGAILEMARSGEAEDVKGYATFHGSLETPEGQSYPPGTPEILIAHGGADGPVSVAADLAQTLEDAGVPYLLEVYAGAPHAFTVFGGDRYDERADEASWAAFTSLLERRLAAD
ncbi:dienelactone hydrolase family protein [Parvularcula dongshanensis]|uniref:Dienelactone hydrolase n=1 Tax=Parvularcula dongshanensis TaxID=1173995 RepID=A0A840HZC0_9PROT|nr:dienelactone hydrolase family protein [Parvularcula dongshanensis]MBB4657909.1 dienelactone hydrolase [Parvularcula dongshanensis]